MGWGPIPWLLMSEIFPLHVKGVATGVCVLTNWLMAFLVTKEFSSLMVSPGPGGHPLTVNRAHVLELLSVQKIQDPWPRVPAGAPPGALWLPWSVVRGRQMGRGRGKGGPFRPSQWKTAGPACPLDIGYTGWEAGLCEKTLALEWAGLGSNPALAISLLCGLGPAA